MMPQPLELTHDLSQAERFLSLLDETAEFFTFQTFDDDKRRKNLRMAIIVSGSLDQHAALLQRGNRAGAGIFVTVNATDGKGRKLENIQRIRAIFHEDDTPQAFAREFPLSPHIVVESSPGKCHRYWMVDGLSIEQFRGVMECMARVHGSDPNAKDPARVLRLPGFFHLKDAAHPHLVRIVEASETLPYSAEEILQAFPAPAVEPSADPAADGVVLDRAKLQELRSALSFIDASARDTWLTVGMALHSTGAKQAYGLWDEWSQSTSDGNYDPAGQRSTWTSFGKRTGKLTTLASLFELAKRGGWVKPLPSRATATVSDISDENAARVAMEQRIREADGDISTLLYVLTPEILASGLREATKSLLLKLISEGTGVSVGALRKDGPKSPPPPRDDGQEAPEAFMAELNEKHAVVPVAGRVLILNREYDPSLRRPLLTFSSRTDFVTRYENRSVRRNGEEVDVGTFWLKDKRRRQCDGIVFMPGGDIPNYYNLWMGWGVSPKPGTCDRFVEFVAEVICAGDSERFAYVWGWMAHLFQRPQELPQTALVLRGAQGIGKNRFAEALGRLVGAHFLQLNTIQQVVGRFSGHLADALLVFANEAIWGGDKSAEGALKAMITDPYSAIEAKGKDIRSCANYKRLIAASNEDWVVPRGKGDRRFVILDVSDKHKEDRAYFKVLHDELRAGGYRALMHELMSSPLEGWHPANIPEAVKTTGWDLALRSATSIERWWYDVLQRGYLFTEETAYSGEDGSPDAGYLWPDHLPTERVQKFYLSWCERHRIPHPESVETFGQYIKRFGVLRLRPRDGGKRVWAYGFPDMTKARAIFSDIFNVPYSEWERYDD